MVGRNKPELVRPGYKSDLFKYRLAKFAIIQLAVVAIALVVIWIINSITVVVDNNERGVFVNFEGQMGELPPGRNIMAPGYLFYSYDMRLQKYTNSVMTHANDGLEAEVIIYTFWHIPTNGFSVAYFHEAGGNKRAEQEIDSSGRWAACSVVQSMTIADFMTNAIAHAKTITEKFHTNIEERQYKGGPVIKNVIVDFRISRKAGEAWAERWKERKRQALEKAEIELLRAERDAEHKRLLVQQELLKAEAEAQMKAAIAEATATREALIKQGEDNARNVPTRTEEIEDETK